MKPTEILLPVLSALMAIALFLGLIFLVRTRMSGPFTLSIPKTIDPEGFRVSVISAHTSSKSLGQWRPFITIGNRSAGNLGASLVLFEDRIEYGVLTSATKRLNEIEEVDVTEILLMKSIILTFKNDPSSFVANVRNGNILKELLRYFQAKKMPLSRKAMGVLGGR